MSGYTFTSISVPGAATTAANGINDKGAIVGSFWDASGHEYGFVETASGTATISVAGAASVAANGINDGGQVVGTFTDAAGVTHGFLDNAGAITTITAPGAVGTAADAINDKGQVVGTFLSPASPADPNAAGPAVNAYLLDPSTGFATIATGRNDGFQGITQPFPLGINDSGVVVGTTQLAPGGEPQAWEFVGGALEPLPVPPGAIGYGATGIDNNGLIIGWYGTANEATIPGGASFLDNAGTLTEMTLPGTPRAINNAGQIVGSAQGEGFLATPAANQATTPATNAMPCFCAGTPIAAEHGPVPVEALRPGERVRTASGRLATVRWVGHRTVTLRGHANPDGVVPVRFAAESFAPGVPRHDVLLSPDHAVFAGGVLIPAHRLVNGATIRRDARAARVTYVHVELDRHDIVLADGLPAESYLDTGNRGQFDRESGVRPLFDGDAEDRLAATLAAYAARGCAPLHLEGAAVAAAHRQLLERAEALGWTRTDDPALAVTADGVAVPAQHKADGTLVFALPAGTRHIRLRSRRFVPAQLDATQPDGRVLGAALEVRLDGVPPAPEAFGRGWHAAEPDWRWTDGDARLTLTPTPRGMRLEMRCLRFGAFYWAAPEARAPRGRAAAG